MRSPCPQNRTERKLPERTYSEPWWSEMKSLSRVRPRVTPMSCSPPGSSVHRILQARVLEWIAISSSKTLVRAPFSLVLRAEGEFSTERASTNSVKLVRDGGERTVTQDLKRANKNDGVSSSSPVGRACSLHHRRLRSGPLSGVGGVGDTQGHAFSVGTHEHRGPRKEEKGAQRFSSGPDSRLSALYTTHPQSPVGVYRDVSSAAFTTSGQWACFSSRCRKY